MREMFDKESEWARYVLKQVDNQLCALQSALEEKEEFHHRLSIAREAIERVIESLTNE